ncbi:MAG: hypothetical protein WCT07_04225 [Candidatus Paceibacterota bacterium]|jgi:phosphate/sulfate permease
MSKFSKIIAVIVITPIAVAAIATSFVSVMPQYEVGKSHITGKCKWVEKEGKRVYNGCKQVENGTIERYTNTWVY